MKLPSLFQPKRRGRSGNAWRIDEALTHFVDRLNQSEKRTTSGFTTWYEWHLAKDERWIEIVGHRVDRTTGELLSSWVVGQVERCTGDVYPGSDPLVWRPHENIYGKPGTGK